MGRNDDINNFGGQTLDPGVSTAVRVMEGSRVESSLSPCRDMDRRCCAADRTLLICVLRTRWFKDIVFH
jgi:hypothetical protein